MNDTIDWNLMAAGIMIGFALGIIFTVFVFARACRRPPPRAPLWVWLVLLGWAPLSVEAAVTIHPATGKAYLVSAEPMSWHQARAFADAAGGYLVEFESIVEMDFVRTSFGRVEIFWLGMEEFDGQYRWVTGGDPLFSYWGAEDPTPLFGHSTVFNWPNSRGFTRGFFFQVPYGSKYRAVVEIEPSLVIRRSK